MQAALFVLFSAGLLAGVLAQPPVAAEDSVEGLVCFGRHAKHKVCANDGKIYGNRCELRGNMTKNISLGFRCKLSDNYVQMAKTEQACTCPPRALFVRLCNRPDADLQQTKGLLSHIYKGLNKKSVCLTDGKTYTGDKAVCGMIEHPTLGVRCGGGCDEEKCKLLAVKLSATDLHPDDVML